MTPARGFSLIEVLVATVVLSVGLLGAAGLLLDGLRNRSQALRREAATALVVDMAERIRANPEARGLYDSRNMPASAAPCDAGIACDSAMVASHDLAHFARMTRSAFPAQEPQASVSFEPATGPALPDRYQIALRWREAPGEDPNHDVTLILLAHAPVAGAA